MTEGAGRIWSGGSIGPLNGVHGLKYSFTQRGVRVGGVVPEPDGAVEASDGVCGLSRFTLIIIASVCLGVALVGGLTGAIVAATSGGDSSSSASPSPPPSPPGLVWTNVATVSSTFDYAELASFPEGTFRSNFLTLFPQLTQLDVDHQFLSSAGGVQVDTVLRTSTADVSSTVLATLNAFDALTFAAATVGIPSKGLSYEGVGLRQQMFARPIPTYVMSPFVNTYSEAVSACGALGNRMARAYNAAELAALATAFNSLFGTCDTCTPVPASPSGKRAFIDGWRDPANYSHFEYTDGTQIDFIEWNTGEPSDNHPGEDCVEMIRTGVLNDVHCEPISNGCCTRHALCELGAPATFTKTSADGQKCADRLALTFEIPVQATCAGWSGVDLQTCANYCATNSVPGLCEFEGRQCTHFTHFADTQFCHLYHGCDQTEPYEGAAAYAVL